jgi:hypothetical protein
MTTFSHKRPTHLRATILQNFVHLPFPEKPKTGNLLNAPYAIGSRQLAESPNGGNTFIEIYIPTYAPSKSAQLRTICMRPDTFGSTMNFVSIGSDGSVLRDVIIGLILSQPSRIIYNRFILSIVSMSYYVSAKGNPAWP